MKPESHMGKLLKPVRELRLFLVTVRAKMLSAFMLRDLLSAFFSEIAHDCPFPFVKKTYYNNIKSR